MTHSLTQVWAYALRPFRLVAHGNEPEAGQTLAEYALILALIAVVVIAAVIVLQGSISGLFGSVSSAI
jgi:Flp pilus assembly pilin Flp